MKKIIFFAKLAAITTVASLALSACNNNNSKRNRTKIAIPVYVTEITKGGMERFNTTNGTLAPTGSAGVVTLTSGAYIPAKNPRSGRYYKIGDVVRKGEIIATLEDKEYENNISLETKKINLEIAKGEYDKYIALQKKGGATQTEIKNAAVRVSTATTNYENAKIAIEKMKITSPISGVIVDLTHYTPGVKINSGSAVFTVMDYSKMLLPISLSESSMSSVKIGQPVYITHYSMPNDTIRATVDQLSPAIDAQTRTYKGVILVNNQSLKLKPGMFVKTDIVTDEVRRSIVIPKDVIKKWGSQIFVFVADGTTAIQRSIRTGIENDEFIEVIKGLEVGDKLITEGYETLKNNSKIQIQK